MAATIEVRPGWSMSERPRPGGRGDVAGATLEPGPLDRDAFRGPRPGRIRAGRPFSIHDPRADSPAAPAATTSPTRRRRRPRGVDGRWRDRSFGGDVEAVECVVDGALSGEGAGEAREVAGVGRRPGRPVAEPSLEVSEQPAERADVLVVVSDDVDQRLGRRAAQEIEIASGDLPALHVTVAAEPEEMTARRCAGERRSSGAGTDVGRSAAGPGDRHGRAPADPWRRYRATRSGQSKARPL